MESVHRALAQLIARLRPEAWDAVIPHGPPSVFGPRPEPWRQAMADRLSMVALNPQPLPPGELYAMALSDALIQEVFGYEAMGHVLGGRATANAAGLAVRAIAEFEELCPRWPRWPRTWPPPPPPPWPHEEMTQSELLFVAGNFLAAADIAREGPVAEALDSAGSRLMAMSLGRD